MRMVQGTKKMGAAAITTAAAVMAVLAAGQTAAAQPPAPQQQAIPDAPRPQALPKLNSITPVSTAVPDAPPAAPPTNASTDGQSNVPSALSSSPATSVSALQEEGDTQEVVHQDAFRIVTTTNFVEVPFSVKDSKSQLVPGLKPRDVRIYENGLRQQVRLFTVDPFPLSVALVIDQSVTFDVMTKVNYALAALQGAFTPYDEVAVFTYNNGVREQTAFTAAQSARLGQILSQSKGKGVEPHYSAGGPLSQTTYKNGQQVDAVTAPNHGNPGAVFNAPEKEFHTLNDAILAAASETSKAAKGRRRIVYVISDGKEYGSKAKEKDVIRYCQGNSVAVYATLVGDSAVPGLGFLDRIHLPLTMRDDVLPRYAGATGGQVDPEFRQRGIEMSFAKITEEVRTQYTVGYYSHEPMLDGKFRKLEVRVARPNLTVIAKDGYYPRPSSSAPPVSTPRRRTVGRMLQANAVLALLAALLWGGGDFSGGMGVRHAGGTTAAALRVVMLSHISSFAVLLAIVLLRNDPLPHGVLLGWGLLAGFCGGVSLTCFYTALSRGAMGAAAAVSGLLAAAIPAAVSIAVEGRPTGLRIAGFCSSCDSYLADRRRPEGGKRAAVDDDAGGCCRDRVRRVFRRAAYGESTWSLYADDTGPRRQPRHLWRNVCMACDARDPAEREQLEPLRGALGDRSGSARYFGEPAVCRGHAGGAPGCRCCTGFALPGEHNRAGRMAAERKVDAEAVDGNGGRGGRSGDDHPISRGRGALAGRAAVYDRFGIRLFCILILAFADLLLGRLEAFFVQLEPGRIERRLRVFQVQALHSLHEHP